MIRRMIILLVAASAFIAGCGTPIVLQGKLSHPSSTWLVFSNKNTEALEYMIFVPPVNGFKSGIWVYVDAPSLYRPPGDNSSASAEKLQEQVEDLRLRVEDLISGRDTSDASADSLRAEVRAIQRKLLAEKKARAAKSNGGPIVTDKTDAVECPVGMVTFSYIVLERGQPKGSTRKFKMFIKPAPDGEARVINLVGKSL